MATMHRARAVLKIKRRNTASVTGKAKAMNQGMGNNTTLFTAPNPALSAIMAQVATTDKAEVLAGTGAKGTAKARDVQRGILAGLLEAGVLYVQGIADKSATPEQAAATIEAAGLTVALVPTHVKPVLGVKQGPTSGSVRIDANATILKDGSHGVCFFNWRYTANGGATWLALPSTPKARTTLANLTPLTSYGFQVSLTDSNGIAGEWSQVVSFLVH